MIDHLVHEIAVVTDHNDTAVEVLQILLQNLQRIDVQVIGRLVEHQEVGVLHKHRTQVQAPLLSARELGDVVLLLQRSEHEVLQELHGRQVATAAQIHILRYLTHRVYHFHLRVKAHPLLAVVAEADGLAHYEASRVGLHQSEQHLHKGTLARTVASHDAHLLVSREAVIEVLQYYVLVLLAHIFGLEYPAAYIG